MPPDTWKTSEDKVFCRLHIAGQVTAWVCAGKRQREGVSQVAYIKTKKTEEKWTDHVPAYRITLLDRLALLLLVLFRRLVSLSVLLVSTFSAFCASFLCRAVCHLFVCVCVSTDKPRKLIYVRIQPIRFHRTKWNSILLYGTRLSCH